VTGPRELAVPSLHGALLSQGYCHLDYPPALALTLKLPSPNFMEWASKMLKDDSWKRPVPMVFLALQDDPYSAVVSSASSAVSGLTMPTLSTQGNGSQLVIPPANKGLVVMGSMDQPASDKQAKFEPFCGITVKIGPIPADDNDVPFCLSSVEVLCRS
jgi:hypothetical protein